MNSIPQVSRKAKKVRQFLFVAATIVLSSLFSTCSVGGGGVVVNTKEIGDTFSYPAMEVFVGETRKSSNATWTGAAAGQTVEYSLINPPAGISVNTNTGVVTVDAGVLNADTTVTIRARGTGNFTGEIDYTLNVTLWNRIPADATLT